MNTKFDLDKQRKISDKEYFLDNKMLVSSAYMLKVTKNSDMNLIDENKLAQIMANLDNASDIINEYLTNRKSLFETNSSFFKH